METSNIKFYLSTDETWEAIYKDCKNARSSIEFEQYIIYNDEIGHKFLKLFSDKAQAGVRVRLLLDRVGSRTILGTKQLEEAINNGVEVRIFNHLKWWNIFFPKTWFPRNHTKTLLLDSELVYTGGVCIAKYMKGWRDTQISFTGAMVDDVKRDFDNIWNRPTKIAKAVSITNVHDKFRYVYSRPKLSRNPIYNELLNEINNATESICLACPFFFPPRKLQRYLSRAARRGIDVRLMISEVTDNKLADHVSHSYFPKLIRSGIKIYLYKKTVLHAKYMVIGNEWATIGSTNLDYLSLVSNREANVIARDVDFTNQLKGQFQNDMKNCIQINKNYWFEKPLPLRIIGRLGRVMKKML